MIRSVCFVCSSGSVGFWAGESTLAASVWFVAFRVQAIVLAVSASGALFVGRVIVFHCRDLLFLVEGLKDLLADWQFVPRRAGK
jgi:hypothetical protein